MSGNDCWKINILSSLGNDDIDYANTTGCERYWQYNVVRCSRSSNATVSP